MHGARGGSSAASTQRVLMLALLISMLLNFYLVWKDTIDQQAVQQALAKCRTSAKAVPAIADQAAPEKCVCPEPVPCPKTNGGDGDGDNTAPDSLDSGADSSNYKQGNFPEEGWNILDRRPSKTDNTIYDPKNDKALTLASNRYARSPVPKGSWKVRVGKDKWVTMDEVAFAYDVWFEENQIFSYASWMGVFVQQDPMDAFAIQDMLWRVKPDLIIEIGSNTGGGAIFYATVMKAYNPEGKIVTIDVKDISNWNTRNMHRCEGCKLATEHPWWNDGMINFIKGRVTDKATRDKIDPFVEKAKKVMVIEDASHRYPDTLQNIEATYHYVSPGSYLLVQDTKMDRFVAGLGKKYGKLKFGPMRSVDEFLGKHSDEFVIDRRFEYFLYSQHHRGFLRRKG